MNVKINNKEYTMTKLGMRSINTLEDNGINIIKTMQNGMIFTQATACVMLCANCSRQAAEDLVEQHVDNGGEINTLTECFATAMLESDFFKKLLGIKNEEKTAEK